MSLLMPKFCLVPCVAAASIAAMLLVSCGRKDADSKGEAKAPAAPGVEKTVPEAPVSTAAVPVPATLPPASPEERKPDAPPPPTEAEKAEAANRANDFVAARQAAMRRSALAAEKLASRARALEKSDDPDIQAALKFIEERKATLAAAEAAVEAARDSVAAAQKDLHKLYEKDAVWAEFKAEADAARKEAEELSARIQIETQKALKRGFHLTPPPSSPAP